jgi:hypothetical protein
MIVNRVSAIRTFIAVGVILAAVACARPPVEVAVKPVPAALDSAEAALWVAAERRACRGRFETIIDESVIAPATNRDSTPTLRYVQRVSGVRCSPST